VDACGGEAAGGRVDAAGDDIGGEHVGAVGVGVAEEVGQCDGWVVGIVQFVEFHHLAGACRDIWNSRWKERVGWKRWCGVAANELRRARIEK
jgi:hypothetical protein